MLESDRKYGTQYPVMTSDSIQDRRQPIQTVSVPRCVFSYSGSRERMCVYSTVRREETSCRFIEAVKSFFNDY